MMRDALLCRCGPRPVPPAPEPSIVSEPGLVFRSRRATVAEAADLPVAAPDILIESEFDGVFRAQWPGVFASPSADRVVAGYDAPENIHNGHMSFCVSTEEGDYDGPQSLRGGIYANKGNSNPSVSVNLAAARPPVPGATYSYEIVFPLGFMLANKDASFPATLVVRIGKVYDATDYLSYSYDPPGAPTLTEPDIHIIKGTFTVAPGESNLDLVMRVIAQNGAGGAADGKPIVSYAKIARIF